MVQVADVALAALFVSGLVNTVINLMPLRFLPGWTLIRWRRGVWLAAFGLALFGLVLVLARSPVSPSSHSSGLVVTILLFVLFGAVSLAFREHFARKWRRSHNVEIHGLKAHLRDLFAGQPGEEEEIVEAGPFQVTVELGDGSGAGGGRRRPIRLRLPRLGGHPPSGE